MPFSREELGDDALASKIKQWSIMEMANQKASAPIVVTATTFPVALLGVRDTEERRKQSL